MEPFEDRIVPSTLVYGRDFEPGTTATLAPGVSASWSNTNKSVTPAGGSAHSGTTFLGDFGNQVVDLNLSGLPGHDQLTISFDVYVLRTWDGDDTGGWGADHWMVKFADTAASAHSSVLLPLVDATFSNRTQANAGHTNATQSFGGQAAAAGSYTGFTGSVEHGTLGYNVYRAELGTTEDMSAVYHFTFTVPSTASTGTFSFSGYGLQSLADESWGIDNVQVTAAINHPPVALDDEADYDGGPVVVPVLGNDSDPDGDALTVSLTSGPAHGTVVLNGDGTFTYTPTETSAAGTDSFTYTLTDAFGATDTATVTINVGDTIYFPVEYDEAATEAEGYTASGDDPVGGDPYLGPAPLIPYKTYNKEVEKAGERARGKALNASLWVHTAVDMGDTGGNPFLKKSGKYTLDAAAAAAVIVALDISDQTNDIRDRILGWATANDITGATVEKMIEVNYAVQRPDLNPRSGRVTHNFSIYFVLTGRDAANRAVTYNSTRIYLSQIIENDNMKTADVR